MAAGAYRVVTLCMQVKLTHNPLLTAKFLPRDDMQARPMPSCGARVCVRVCVHHVRIFCQNE